MKKALIITSTFAEQDSVNTISKNIISAYQKIDSVNVLITDFEAISDTKEIKEYDFIIIIHPSVIMNEKISSFIEGSHKSTVLIFYIFGDFIRKSPYYLKLNECLSGRKVFFYAASTSYENLIKKALIQPKACLKVPFPINTTTFSYKKANADKFRKKYKFKKNDLVVLYTGRISPQKNIHLLIKTMQTLNATEQFKNRLKLFICGNVDEFETSTFFEKNNVPGQYFQTLSKIINNDSSIKIVPHLPHRELIAAYSGSNLFSSLSLYHDEDFGYSPLEALCVGTPVLLTKWGGYNDLQISSGPDALVEYIDIKFTNNFLEINEKELLKTMGKALLSSKSSLLEVKKIRKKYSIASLAKEYEKNLKEEPWLFEGFHEDLSNLTLSMLTANNPSIETYQYFYESFWNLN